MGGRSGSAFGGPAFWSALKDTGVEREVRALYLDAKKTLQRMGGLSMQVQPLCRLHFEQGRRGRPCCERVGVVWLCGALHQGAS